MELHKIKQFVKNNGDKFVFVEDGEPSLVVMSFHEYEKITNGHGVSPPQYRGGRDTEMAVASVEAERMRVRQEELGAWGSAQIVKNHQKSPENVRLEDLPL